MAERTMANLSERQLRWLLASVGVGCFTLLTAFSLVSEGADFTLLDFIDDTLTALLTIGSAVGVALLFQRMQAQHEEQLALLRDLDIARAEGEGWRSQVQSHLAGIKDAMDQQFQAWGMTVAEREVGLLILKGLSHKEIAALRATTDATVRQQAQAIYRKAGLPGKTAFSAYFLEDLFVPAEATNDMQAPSPQRTKTNGALTAERLI
jgi:DNA-binding CsgD family transcriptional regulator